MFPTINASHSVAANSMGGFLRRKFSRAILSLIILIFAIPVLAVLPAEPDIMQAMAQNLDAGPEDAAVPGHVPGQILVKYKAGRNKNKADIAMRGHGAKKIKHYKVPKRILAKKNARAAEMSRWVRIDLDPGKDEVAVLAEVLKDPDVAAAHLNRVYQLHQVPNDPDFSQLWGLHNTAQTGGVTDADIDAPEAWDTTTGSNTIIVGVVDSGVDYTHPDLAANMWVNPGEIPNNGIDDDNNGYVDDINGVEFYDFTQIDGDPMDDLGHGTHVAGTIAAVGNNGIGVVGVNWTAKIMNLKIGGPTSFVSVDAAVEATLYAIDMGAHVLNNSWGGGGTLQALEDAILLANDAGIVYVASAGNSSSNNDVTPVYPASYDVPNVISVAATDHNDFLANFSSFGLTTVDLGAPGVCVRSTFPTGPFTFEGAVTCGETIARDYGSISGTSMAAPHVAGAAALLLSQSPTLTPSEVKFALMASTDSITALTGITASGGRLNINNMLACDNQRANVSIISPGEGFVAKLDPEGNNEVGNPVVATVHNCSSAIPGATVTASFDNGDPNITLFDDGANGDGAAADGVYGNTWYADAEESVTITITASGAGYTVGSGTVSGEVRGGDLDGDGLTDLFEVSIGTDPLDPDTDNDGVTDGDEVCHDGDCNSYDPYPSGGDMNPLVQDTDGDGFTDGQDVKFGGNPTDPSGKPWRQFTVLKFEATSIECIAGEGTPPDNCTYGTVLVGGSYIVYGGFRIDLSPGPDGGLYLGVIQPASGTHAGPPDGTEDAGVDDPWSFFQTGLHKVPNKPISIISITDNGDGTATMELDFGGWGVAWSYGAPFVSMGGGIRDCGTTSDGICMQLDGNDLAGIYNNGTGIATVTCDTPDCAPGSRFSLEYSATSPQWAPYFAFAGVPYSLHMEGEIGTSHPVIPFDSATTYYSLWMPSLRNYLTPGPDGGLYLDEVQPASGSHSGAPNGSENPGIDQPWMFFQTGMHQTTTEPVNIASVTDNGDGTSTVELDFSGWAVTWNYWPFIDLGGGLQDCGTANDGICTYPWGVDIAGVYNNGTGIATATCSTSNCGYDSEIVLDYSARTPQGFPTFVTGNLPYELHMEGPLVTTVSDTFTGQ